MQSIHFFRLRHAAACVFLSVVPLAAAGQGVPGVPNFQVVNERVLRGGQPSDEGFRNLAARGVRTILDLRESDERSRAEKKLVESLGMRYINIAMKGMHTPTEKQISGALKLLGDESAGPVFVHCRRGADRTGAVVACYRIQHDNWNNTKALQEARGYGMRWFEFQLASYVMGYGPRRDSPPIAATAEVAPLKP